MKKTVVVGVSPEGNRYANIACRMLAAAGHEFVPLGIKSGEVEGIPIVDIRQKPVIENVHTVTLYLSPMNQVHWYDYILKLQPKRIIFNPGAENAELAKLANAKGIETEFACNLVLLSTGQY